MVLYIIAGTSFGQVNFFCDAFKDAGTLDYLRRCHHYYRIGRLTLQLDGSEAQSLSFHYEFLLPIVLLGKLIFDFASHGSEDLLQAVSVL